jgi:hypothetical protein
MNVMEQGNQFVPYFYKRKNYSTKNVELAMWVWVVWKNCEKNRVEKMWKIIL